MTTEAPPRRRGAQLMPGWTIAALAGPLLLALTNALVIFAPGAADVVDTASNLEQIAANPGLTEVIVIVGLAACVLLVPGIWGVAQILAPRTRVLATVGGWLMATGYVLATSLSTDSATALAIASAGGDPATYIDAVDNHTPVSMMLTYGVFGIGALAGGIVLAIAMLRQRDVVPAWAGWALLASEPVRMAGLALGIPVGPPLASLLIMVGFAGVVLVARRRETAADDGVSAIPASAGA